MAARDAVKAFLESDRFKIFLEWASALDQKTIEQALKEWGDQLYDSDLRDYFVANSWLINGGHFTAGQLKGLGELLANENHEELDRQICERVESWIGDIQTVCQGRLPDSQNKILERAFSSHAVGDWIVSVPLFLKQADGICRDRFFGAKDNIGKIDIFSTAKPKILNRLKDKAYFPFLAILKHQSENTLVKSASAGSPDIPLNRHLVLHGVDRDYDNRANSLRAMAAVDFAVWLCEIADEADGKWKAERANKETDT